MVIKKLILILSVLILASSASARDESFHVKEGSVLPDGSNAPTGIRMYWGATCANLNVSVDRGFPANDATGARPVTVTVPDSGSFCFAAATFNFVGESTKSSTIVRTTPPAAPTTPQLLP